MPTTMACSRGRFAWASAAPGRASAGTPAVRPWRNERRFSTRHLAGGSERRALRLRCHLHTAEHLVDLLHRELAPVHDLELVEVALAAALGIDAVGRVAAGDQDVTRSHRAAHRQLVVVLVRSPGVGVADEADRRHALLLEE